MGGADSPPGHAAPTWSDVYLDERDGLVRLAYLLTRSQAAAEDLVQDVFLRVMAKLPPEGDGSGVGPYLRRSVINACYTWQKRAARERPSDHTRWERSPYLTSLPTGGDDVEMWDALGRLPIKARTVLVLRFYLDLTEADTAEAIGCRPGTVKSSTHRALAELRKVIER